MIRDICENFDMLVSTMDLTDFKGIYYDCADDVDKYLKDNKELFTYKGIDFSDYIFIDTLVRWKANKIWEGVKK